MPGRVATPVDLRTTFSRIFDQVQTSTVNHQKNFIALHKLHLEAAKRTVVVESGTKLVGEREFEAVFLDMLSRVLPVKKGATNADRVVRFVGGYVHFINDREDKDEDEDNEENDTTASRFTAKLLKFLLKGFQAKDKVVRYRVIFLSSEMLGQLGELDEEIYQDLRTALLDRIHDKEAMVRVQVVIALSKMAGSGGSSDPDEQAVLNVLWETLSSDNSADVRRAVLCNMPVSADTIPALLLRSRDTEATVRKLLFSNVLEKAATTEYGNPRKLTIAEREIIVRNGLGDREKTVRAAAATLLGTWIDVLGDDDTKAEEELATRLADVNISEPGEKPSLTAEEKQQKIVKTLTTFLSMFDLTVVSPDAGGEMLCGKLPSDALRSVFDTRPDIFEDLYFDDAFFANLTMERIFIARVFVDHCISLEDKGRGEQKMESAGIPVVTSCAFRIQAGYNDLVVAEEEMEALRQNGRDDDEKEEARLAKEFTVSEMLRLAVNLDYSDEIGRRKMFALVRDMLTRPTLPLDLVPRCLDVLRQLSPDERDLIRVVVEIVQDLRVPGDEEDDLGAADQSQDSINLDGDADASFSSQRTAASKKPVKAREDMSPEEQMRTDLIDMRCLSLCIGMLERVNGTLEENSTLQGLLADLIVPAVKCKDEQLRKMGLIALGLFCLIAKSLALKSLPLFVSQAEANVPEALRLNLLKIIFDLLMVHGGTILAPGGEYAESIPTFLMTQLTKESDKDDTSPKVLALLGTGIAKLILAGMINDEKTVESLLMVYFSPYNAENQELKQCVAFFAPVYSHSSARNQRVMRDIFTSVFVKLSKLHQVLEDDEEVVDLMQVAGMWLYWTDPFQVHGRTGDAGDPLIQFEMAVNIIRSLLKNSENLTKDDKKILCQMLGKLHIPDEVDVDNIRTLKLLMHTLNLRRPLRDATSNNTFKKFDAAISKKFEKELQDFDEDEYRKLEELKDLFEFLDDIVPEDDGEVINIDAKKKGRKRRSDSIMSTITDGDDVSVASSTRGKSKPKAK
ncbi:nuclear condensing complex subunit [Mycena maculata]|uniref:Nuclear condensing complex subunit n=1 Tax=Mycena maculata TaxID=230809 RepID=A0AAD7HKP4_9AGAR|nr:nuclear condensing complex subunit [Mycena maculata]